MYKDRGDELLTQGQCNYVTIVVCFIFRTAECTFTTAEYTFTIAECTFRTAEHKTYTLSH